MKKFVPKNNSIPYAKQQKLYYIMTLYKILDEKHKAIIDKCIYETCREYATAMKVYLTTSATTEYVTTRYYLSKSSIMRQEHEIIRELNKRLVF